MEEPNATDPLKLQSKSIVLSMQTGQNLDFYKHLSKNPICSECRSVNVFTVYRKELCWVLDIDQHIQVCMCVCAIYD